MLQYGTASLFPAASIGTTSESRSTPRAMS
jgi:hypothetical protein